MLQSPWNTIFSLYVIRLVQTPATIGLILCIVGATQAKNPLEIFDQTTLKAGIVIYAVVVVVLSLLCLGAILAWRKRVAGERPIMIALGWSLPLLLILIMYAVAEAFGSHAPGSILVSSTGSQLLRLFLESIEEIAITVIYIAAGMTADSVPSPKTHGGESGLRSDYRDTAHRLSHRARRGDFGGGKLGLITLAGEVASGLQRENNKQGTRY